MDMYADDTTVSSSWKTLEAVQAKLSEDLSKIEKWYASNKMVINTMKTKSMFLSTHHKLNRLYIANGLK